MSAGDSITRFRERFRSSRVLIGMIHVGALPGTPSRTANRSKRIASRAAERGARSIATRASPRSRSRTCTTGRICEGAVGPEIMAAMTVIGREVQRACPLPLGIQILAGANREAVAAAHACGADFVRVEGFVFAHVADEGLIESCAGELLRYRRAIGAERVLVFADIKKKHSAHAITADVSIAETAHAAELFLADGLIVTGLATGRGDVASGCRGGRRRRRSSDTRRFRSHRGKSLTICRRRTASSSARR